MASLPVALGERLLFASFVRQHEIRMSRFFLRAGLTSEDAQDLSQESFFTYWKNRSRVVIGKEEQFLFGIARKTLLAFQRKGKPRERHVNVGMDESAYPELLGRPRPNSMGQEAEPDDFRAELKSRIREGLSHLSPRQRQVLDLIGLQGLSRSEAARRLGITESSLRSHLSIGLMRLRKRAEAAESEDK